jgi:hypothetical protein
LEFLIPCWILFLILSFFSTILNQRSMFRKIVQKIENAFGI